jgi:hypothetical protein
MTLPPPAAFDAAHAARGDKPRFFDDPAVDQLMSLVLALGTELAVTRERLDTVERVLEEAGGLSRQAVENYRPDAAAKSDRARLHQEFLRRFLRGILQEQERLAAADAPSPQVP